MIFNEEDFQLYVEQANIPKDRLYIVVGQAGQSTKNVTFAEKSGSSEKVPRHVGVSIIFLKPVFYKKKTKKNANNNTKFNFSGNL